MRYHLTPEGPKKCEASERECKYAHFDTLEEAYDHIENQMAATAPHFAALKKSPGEEARAKALKSLDVRGDLTEVVSTPAGLKRVQEAIENRLDVTAAYARALDLRDPFSPDSTQPVRKNVHRELKKRFNAFRDRTAQLVEAEDASPHVERTYINKDLPSIGNAVETSSYDANTREWLEERQNTLGGSDVGVIARCDVTPEEDRDYFLRSSLTRVIESKTAPITDASFAKSKNLRSGGHGPLYRGSVWENRIREQFAREYPGLTVINSKSQYQNPDRPWQKINVDGVLSSDGGKTHDGILEIKTASDESKWANGVPLDYRAQTLYYLNATGLKRAKVVVCFRDTEYRVYDLLSTDEVLPGTGKPMDSYIKTRLEPWFRQLKA